MKTIVNKPWGSYQILDEGKKHTLKKIIVNPGDKLSLQSHDHRSEHWLIAEGIAEVIIDNKTFNTNLIKILKIRARRALEHQKTGRDGQDWLDWLHKWPMWAQWVINWGPKKH